MVAVTLKLQHSRKGHGLYLSQSLGVLCFNQTPTAKTFQEEQYVTDKVADSRAL